MTGTQIASIQTTLDDKIVSVEQPEIVCLKGVFIWVLNEENKIVRIEGHYIDDIDK